MNVLEDKLKLLPTNPGVYVMLDKNGVVIYVGKAKNLKNRVKQYFFNTKKPEKVMAMVRNIDDFYYIIAPSEIDALSLENNLIKKYKPRYNILLKDDKTYPYIKVNIKETFPTFTITRKIKKDGARYFGPFMGGISVNGVLDLLNFAFEVRPCDKKLSVTKKIKPCLNYHIKKCLAPCAGCVTESEYLERVNLAIDFLSGDITETERLLREKMFKASENEEFELALKLKEHIVSLDKIKLKRLTALNKFISADIISCISNGLYTAINILFVRNGRMLGGKNFSFLAAETNEEALKEFVLQYYKKGYDIPDEIVFNLLVEDTEIISDYIKQTFDKKTTIVYAKQGVRKQLSKMAEDNANEYLCTMVGKIEHKFDMTIKACEHLKDVLKLNNYPKRMECYDISNISGVDKVGSMVVFIDGESERDSYRRFRIKTVEGANDFASLKEVLGRRLERLKDNDQKFPKPDLIIIDGGKGQLSSVKEVFDSYDINDIDLISLAEREEEVFIPNQSESIKLDKHDYSLKMLQRIRDEAHRFAITYFRALHGKNSLSSVLDQIKGLGKIKKLALINKFKDLGTIISASKEQLQQVEGIGEKESQNIIEALTKEGLK